MKRLSNSHIYLSIAVLSVLVFSRPITTGAGVCDAGSPDNSVARTDLSETSPDPAIAIWYGHNQRFGHIGNPQQWVNILGNASDPNGIASLTYSLNGGPELDLNIGPDGYRLASTGDFNVEIDYSDLLSGTNQVVITATDTLANTTAETVTVEYVSGNVWPRPYSVDWSSVENIQEVAQIVDGLWTVEGDYIRPVGASIDTYDRLVAIGDVSWVDYEVTVPITIHEFFGVGPEDPGVGILVRWNGHGDDSQQPHYAHPFGGLGWFRFLSGSDVGLLNILGNNNFYIAIDDSGRQLELEEPYVFKMRVETELSGKSRYSFKVWNKDDPEPPAWDLSGYGAGIDPVEAHGSMLLVAHRTDASFGDVIVTCTEPEYTLTVNAVGNGSVTKDPDQPTYCNGHVVTLTATADVGWNFSGWSGDLSGSNSPETITMDGDKSVTATFTQEEYTLTVNTVGNGWVAKDPEQSTYHYGEVVNLTANADDGWSFSGWSGDLSGTNNPENITMDSNKSVTATFTQEEYTLTVNIVGNGSVAKDPEQSTYHYGEVVTLTATADDRWSFSGWSGDLWGTDNPETITMDGNKSVTASFVWYRILLPVVTRSH